MLHQFDSKMVAPMIKILDNTKTLSELEADTSGGIGSLDVFDATVTEELNGIYEAEFKILVSEKYYSDLAIDSIVKIPVNEAGEEQLFRVYYISPEIDGMALVKLQHITYDLSRWPCSRSAQPELSMPRTECCRI